MESLRSLINYWTCIISPSRVSSVVSQWMKLIQYIPQEGFMGTEHSEILTLMLEGLCSALSHSVMSNSLRPHGLQPTRLLCPWGFFMEWVAKPSSRGSSQPRDRTQVSCIADTFFTNWATRQAQEYWSGWPIPSPVDLPNPGIELGSLAFQADSSPTELSGKCKATKLQ